MKNREVNLPHELVVEILSRLPIKHLCPLRFLSKSWFQLLTKNPQFAKLQFDRFMQSNPNPSIVALKQQNDSNLLLATDFESCDKALTLQLPFYPPTFYPGLHHLSGNCNGLLCVSHFYDKNQVYIWNPLTNDHVTITCLPAPSKRSPSYHDSTAFGFGFDQESNVYKVVRCFNETDLDAVSGKFDTWTQISVYTVGVDSMWRTVQVDVPCYLSATHRVAPLINGVLHWKTMSPDVIFTFDLKTEVIGKFLPTPCGMEYNEIVELGGLLCVVDTRAKSEIHIWVMKKYGQVTSWSKQYIIGKPQGGCYHLLPLGLTDNGEIIIKKQGCNIGLYSPETNTVRDLNRFPDKIDLSYTYIGSIISPKTISSAGHNKLEEESQRS